MYKPCTYTYRYAKMQVFPVEHGLQCRISQSQLACNAKVPVPFQCYLNLQAIYCNSASSRTVSRLQLVCQYLLILLDEATTAVEAKNTKKNILVVCQMCNTLDEFIVCMFRALARCIFSPPPHNNFSYFVKYAVSFLEIPSFSSANPIRQIVFRVCRSALLFWCNRAKSRTLMFHSLLSMFQSKAWTKTSAISLLGSTTGGTLYSGEVLSLEAAVILAFSSATY